jgi:hypothetical protein
MPDNETPKADAPAVEEVLSPVEEAVAKAGPSKEQIDEWKKLYGKLEIAAIADSAFIYRQISRTEHQKMVADGVFNKENVAEEVVKAYLVYPSLDELDFESAGGTALTLYENILLFSGFGNRSEPITL